MIRSETVTCCRIGLSLACAYREQLGSMTHSMVELKNGLNPVQGIIIDFVLANWSIIHRNVNNSLIPNTDPFLATSKPSKSHWTVLKFNLWKTHHLESRPYIWTELAPVLEGCRSRRRHPRKGTSVDCVCGVFVARVDRRLFTIRQKRIRGGGTFTEGNSALLKQPRLLLWIHHWHCFSDTHR